jgi:1,2-diacylglycerol 3-beta-galactosyltransferase
MRNLDFIFFDAGGGHRSAATALKTVVDEQGRDWAVRLVNLQEVLDSLDVFRKITGIRLEDIYNRMLASGLTLGSEYLLPAMQAVIRMYHPAQVRVLAEYWSRQTPDLLVSLVPNLNRALFEGLRRVTPNVPMVTILTDFADYPPHFWIERQDQFFICGTERALEQARAMGHPPSKTFLVSGMILRPSFYRTFDDDRAAARARLDLDPNQPTGIVLFGGHGSRVMVRIAQELSNSSRDLQLIMICGRNEKLATELRTLKTRVPLHVVGFTQEVPHYMSLSDFFIGKPGPGSISEALAMHLPVIVERNSWTLPQERYNADWVREKQVGLVVGNFREIRSAVDQLLEPATLASYRANAAAIRNRALYEIPEILENILEQR